MSYALQVIKRTPTCDLAIEQIFLLELHRYMTDFRHAVNKVRLRGARPYEMQHLSYLKGRVDGFVFGLANTLIDRHTFDAPAISIAYESAMSETSFLLDEYVHRAARQ